MNRYTTLLFASQCLLLGCADAPRGSVDGGTRSATPTDEVTSSNDPRAEDFPTDGPSITTPVTCADAVADCGYWYCRCTDGAVVNASFCVDGYCATDAAACSYACDFFGHGEWHSTAGGGPGGSVPAMDGGTTVDGDPTEDPGALVCGVFRGGEDLCSTCATEFCCEPADACSVGSECAAYQLCLDDCFGDLACEDECAALYSIGAADHDDLIGCLESACRGECS